MFGSGKIRTGIDLGSTCIKLVRGEGRRDLTGVSHYGCATWRSSGVADDAERAAAALKRLLGQLGLKRKHLGRIAVAIDSEQASFREVVLPPLDEDELQRALPYEAKKHLNLEGMVAPVLAAQILGPAPSDSPDARGELRVLLAAIPATARDFPLNVLARLDLAPQVIDLAPLAGLNALLGCQAWLEAPAAESALGLVDIGTQGCHLHITGRRGGLLSRPVGPGLPAERSAEAMKIYAENLATGIEETLTYYRGRYRQEVGLLHACGGGALVPDLHTNLRSALDRPLTILDPLAGLCDAARRTDGLDSAGALFANACGLCRWGDEGHVQN